MEKINDIKKFLKDRNEKEALFQIEKLLMTMPHDTIVVGGNNPHAANGEWSDIYLILKIKKLISDQIVYKFKVAKISKHSLYNIRYQIGKEYKYLEQAENAARNCNINFNF